LNFGACPSVSNQANYQLKFRLDKFHLGDREIQGRKRPITNSFLRKV
jgi:hypothetical protein